MTEETQLTQVTPIEEPKYKSSLSFRDEVLAKIAAITAQDIQGILTMSGNFLSSVKEAFGQSNITKGISVDINGQDVVIDIEMVMEYGKSAPEIFEALKTHIGEQIRHMTGLNLASLNVRVVDIMSKAEFDQRKGGTKSGSSDNQ